MSEAVRGKTRRGDRGQFDDLCAWPWKCVEGNKRLAGFRVLFEPKLLERIGKEPFASREDLPVVLLCVSTVPSNVM